MNIFSMDQSSHFDSQLPLAQQDSRERSTKHLEEVLKRQRDRFDQLSSAEPTRNAYERGDTMGSNGFMSLETALDTEGNGKLYGVGKQTSQTNPIVYYDSTNTSSTFNNKGITGIMAVQNAADVRCSAN